MCSDAKAAAEKRAAMERDMALADLAIAKAEAERAALRAEQEAHERCVVFRNACATLSRLCEC